MAIALRQLNPVHKKGGAIKFLFFLSKILILLNETYLSLLFSSEEILKRHHKDSFKINGKQVIKMPKKGEHVKLKNYERKIKSPFMIYAGFESILRPEDSGK